MISFGPFQNRITFPMALGVLLLSSFCGSVNAQDRLRENSEDGSIDTVALTQKMAQTSFPTLIPQFEDLLHHVPTLQRADSVFLLRNLGRMAIADQATRQKGKSYLARVAAMCPGEPVWDIYANQLRFESENRQMQPSEFAKPLPLPQPYPPVQEETHEARTSLFEKKSFWLAAGIGGTALFAGVVTYVLLHDSESPEQVDHMISINSL